VRAADIGRMIRHIRITARPRYAWPCLFGLLIAGIACDVEAGYPILSRFTRTADGPYQPQVRRFTVVDPTPVAPQWPVGRHGQVRGADGHSPEATLWARREAGTPAYPYGWFGARHSTEFGSRGSYYDDYEQTSILRGR